MYLLSFGDKRGLIKERRRLKARLSTIIVMGSWAIVQTIYSTLVPAGSGKASTGKASDKKKYVRIWENHGRARPSKGSTYQQASADASKQGFVCQIGYRPDTKAANVICCKSK